MKLDYAVALNYISKMESFIEATNQIYSWVQEGKITTGTMVYLCQAMINKHRD